jgi:hypothetical protein
VISANSPQEAPASLEVWLQPARNWEAGTFLALYNPQDLHLFALRQVQANLELHVENHGGSDIGRTRIRVPDVFRRVAPVFVTLVSNAGGTLIYADGVSLRMLPGFHLSAAAFADRLILGDSPRQTNSWKGQFMGLAFYDHALTPRQVSDHYRTWTTGGRPELGPDDRPAALYLFDEHGGRIIRSKIGSGRLYIPGKYSVIDKEHLEPFWEEFEITRSYGSAILKNVIGFIPLGFFFYPYWSLARPFSKPALATIVLGAAVSFTIEILQSYLPTRDSGMTDLVTNTAGTILGILLYRRIFD